MTIERKTKNVIIALLIMLSTTITVHSQDTLTFTLEEAQAYALENNINAQNARLDIEAAKKTVWETTAIGLPQVSANASYNYVIEQLKIPEIFESFAMPMDSAAMGPASSESVEFFTDQSLQLSATVSQLIFSGEYIVGLQASRTYLQLSKDQLEKVELDTKESVSNSYFSIKTFEESLGYLKEMRANLDTTLMEMRAMVEQGLMEKTDADQIELTMKNIENQYNTLERQQAVMYKLLKIQMGVDMEKQIMLSENLETIFSKYNIEQIAAKPFDIEKNAEFRAMETQVDAMELSRKREQSKYLPTISAFYQYTAMEYPGAESRPAFEQYVPQMVGVSVDIPIFSSGQRHARAQKAKIELEKTRNQQELVRQNLQMAYTQAVYDVNSALDRYYTNKYSLDLSKRIYNNTLAKHKEGMASSLDLSQANNQYLEAYTSYNQSVMELLQSKVKLNKLVNNL